MKRAKIPEKKKTKTKTKIRVNRVRNDMVVPVPSVPLSYAREMKTREPRFVNSKNAVRISHTEMLGQISTESAFTVNYYTVNAGDVSTFPWLSSVARRYERYRFIGLKFHFEPTCPTTSRGYFAMYFDYNSTDTYPPDLMSFMSNNGAVTNPVYRSTSCAINPSLVRERGFLFTQDEYNVPGGGQLNYDVATLYYACQNSGAVPEQVGNLCVTYEVELMQPQLRNRFATPLAQEQASGAGSGTNYPLNYVADKLTNGFAWVTATVGDVARLVNAGKETLSAFATLTVDEATTGAQWTLRSPEGKETDIKSDNEYVKFLSPTQSVAGLVHTFLLTLPVGYMLHYGLTNPVNSVSLLMAGCDPTNASHHAFAVPRRVPDYEFVARDPKRRF